jgi:hypothetical protein
VRARRAATASLPRRPSSSTSQGRTARYKAPRHVVLVDSLDRLPNGSSTAAPRCGRGLAAGVSDHLSRVAFLPSSALLGEASWSLWKSCWHGSPAPGGQRTYPRLVVVVVASAQAAGGVLPLARWRQSRRRGAALR